MLKENLRIIRMRIESKIKRPTGYCIEANPTLWCPGKCQNPKWKKEKKPNKQTKSTTRKYVMCLRRKYI